MKPSLLAFTSRLAGLLILLTIATYTAFDDVAKLAMHLLMLIGLASLLAALYRPMPAWPAGVKWVSIAAVLYFASVLLTFFIQPITTDYDWRKLSDYSYVLLTLLLFPVFARHRPSVKYLWWGVVLCAAASGIQALLEVMQHGINHRAAGSKGKPIPFGDIAMASAFLSIPALTYFKRYPAPLSYLPLLAFGLGATAAALSGTRGAYLYLIPGSIVLAILYHRILFSRRWVLVITLIAICIGAALINQTTVPKRITVAAQEVQLYFESDSERSGSTSIGQRLHMWRVATNSFLSAPWTGVGLGQMPAQYKQAYAEGKIPKVIAMRNNGTGHTHAHNEFFNTLATRGLLGFATLLAFILTPLAIFIDARRRTNIEEQQALANSGILLVAAYTFFSFTDSVLFFLHPAQFYLIMITLITAAISFNEPAQQNRAIK